MCNERRWWKLEDLLLCRHSVTSSVFAGGRAHLVKVLFEQDMLAQPALNDEGLGKAQPPHSWRAECPVGDGPEGGREPVCRRVCGLCSQQHTDTAPNNLWQLDSDLKPAEVAVEELSWEKLEQPFTTEHLRHTTLNKSPKCFRHHLEHVPSCKTAPFSLRCVP